ncbi:MAG: phage holin family protein [Nocardioides sp.]|nr:phage holin family protein [Nocardioides sp.]
MKFLAWLVSYAVALAVAAWFLDGISFDGATWQDKLLPLGIVALIFGVVTRYVGAVVKVLSIPFIIVTVGLFLLVINACLLLFTGWIADQFDVGFHVDGFLTAVIGAIIISLVGGFMNMVLDEEG